MPAYKEENQQYHMERIREVLALHPRVGVIAISKILREDPQAPLNLHPHYILKLKKKIAGERKTRFNQAVVDAHIATMEDEINYLIVQMWAIVLDKTKDERARVMAAKVIMDAKIKLFEAKMDAGIFERQLGTFKVHQTYELKTEQKTLIFQAMANYGIIPPPNDQNQSHSN